MVAHYHLRYVSITPRVNSIAYNSKEAYEGQLPGNPVLSILQFIFHPGVDVSDPSQLVSILWRKSLRYVSTIRGFQSLYWAPMNDILPYQRIIVLIQWESAHAWRLFQFSPGFTMMLGYFESIYNRCIQMTLPAKLLRSDSVLELVSLEFSKPTGQTDIKPDFKQRWETTFAPHVEIAGSELIYCSGEWLEADKVSEDPFFVGLLFWKPDSKHRLGEVNINNLKADLTKDAANVVSVYTSQLNKISSEASSWPDLASGLLPESVVQFQTNHPVFQVPLTPHYNLDEYITAGFKDQAHMESMIQARRSPPERIACGPAGSWCPMGYLSQHHLPDKLGPGSPDLGCNHSWDVIYFRGHLGNLHVYRLFEQLRYKLWKLLGPGTNSRQCWSRERDKDGSLDNVSLFIEIKRKDEEVETKIQLFIEEFSYGCGYAIQDISRRKSPGPGGLWGVNGKKMDMTTFDVSENERDRVSFNYAFSNYWDTTRQKFSRQMHSTPWDALTAESSGWVFDHGRFPSQDTSQQTSAATVQYVSFFTHKKEGSGEEWYNDFAHRVRTEYDLLGHMIDWMRNLSKRITIHSLSMEPEDSWITDERLSRPVLPPPPIFHKSWPLGPPPPGFVPVPVSFKSLPPSAEPFPPSIFNPPDKFKKTSME